MPLKLIEVMNKVKYSKQYDTYSCGAVALLNLHKWLGHKYTNNNLKDIKNRCNCIYKHNNGGSGTFPSDLNKYLIDNNIDFQFKESPNIIDIFDHFYDKSLNIGSIILRTIHHNNGHYSFLHKYDGKYFHIANDYEGFSLINWYDLEYSINNTNRSGWFFNTGNDIDNSIYCLGWFIRS